MGLFGKEKKEKKEKKENDDARRASVASAGSTASDGGAGKPPGSFGWMLGASDSVAMSNDPTAYVRKQTEKLGPLFCAKIASFPSVFGGGYDVAREMFEDAEGFPPHRSLLRMVDQAVGTPFLLEENPTGDQQMRSALIRALNTPSTPGPPSPASPSSPPQLLHYRSAAPPGHFAPALHPDVQRVVDACVADHIGAWVARGSIPGLYQSAKELGNDIMLQLVLGMPLADADARGIPGLQTTQFRGCEAAPVFTPLLTSTFDAGIKARHKLKEVCQPLLFPKGNAYEKAMQASAAGSTAQKSATGSHVGGVLARRMLDEVLKAGTTPHDFARATRENDPHARCPFLRKQTAQQQQQQQPQPTATTPAPPPLPSVDHLLDVFVYLLHGMMPKALGGALTYLWAELTARDEAFWKRLVACPSATTAHVDPNAAPENGGGGPAVDEALLQACVLETMRLHPPIGVMGRGVACPMLRGYNLDRAKHGEWLGWVGIAEGNRDAAAFKDPTQFLPERWLSPTSPLPPLLTFGAGVRSCPGATLALEFLMATTRRLVAVHRARPVVHCTPDAAHKTRPVKKPNGLVQCEFRAVQKA